jgi:pimeloyl-ACP methyl ester carboxylesterase
MTQARVHAGGLVFTQHQLSVPLDHARPDGERITVAATEIADPSGLDRPFLLYLTGGPGMEAPRVTRRDGEPPWLARALTEFRVLMLDQRGTGRSTPLGVPAGTPQQQADYLAHFRADSIVRDAELLRTALGSPPWTVLGQSFGGFCTLAYLSGAPEGLRTALFSGGLPPLGLPVEDVYRATYTTQRQRNERYYARYPGDRALVRDLLDRLEQREVELPTGDRLTGDRLRQLGLGLGMAPGAEVLHNLLALPLDSPAFRHDVEAASPFSRNPLYAVIHEACYADGVATDWAAQRTLPDDWPAEFFTGEHVYRWMFRDIAALGPLAAAADLVATRPWGQLYDLEQLARNEVPAAAIVYADDAYVERQFSEQTAAATQGLRVWLTNEYEHDGLHWDGARILDRLLTLANS